MSQKNLKQKAVSGMIWSALQRYSTMLIQFISGIILARLLTPYDYGCIGMLMIFMAYHGYGVWSLVTQHILTALIPALVFWFYIKYMGSEIFRTNS